MILATTTDSKERAGEAAPWIREMLGDLELHVFLDIDVLGESLYADLPESPETAIESIKDCASRIASQLRAIDITGGVKLEAVLAVLIAAISQRHRGARRT